LVQDIIELLFGLLTDPHLEVREMAATTLSGIVRCSQRKLIKRLRERFAAIVVETRLPKRESPDFQAKLIKLHSGLLGASALIAAFPYDVPPWMPAFICDTVVQHTDDPVPISTTVRRCAADFKRTHQDGWAQQSLKFTEEQLQEVNDFTLGGRDYFA
jgi:proteasome activator subunit 4